MNPYVEQLERSDDINYSFESSPRDRLLSVKGDIFRDIGPVLKDLLENNQLCDGVIKTNDGKAFSVHCTMLSAISPYFRTSFTNLSQAPVREIVMPHISSEIMSVILNFAYTGRLAVSIDNVERLMNAANEVEIPEIIEICVGFMADELNEENCINFYTFSKDYGNATLKKICRKYLLSHFHRIFSMNSDWVRLPTDDLEALLRDDELNVRSEETVFRAVIRWTEEDYLERKMHFANLLGCLRYGLCSLEFFSNTVATHPYVIENQECQPIVLGASIIFAEMQSSPEISPIDFHHPVLRPRIPYEIIFAIGGWSTGSATNVMETYDNRSNRWFISTFSDNMPRAYHGLVSLNELIYMIGGFDGNQCFNTMRCFDPVEHVWREKACMYNSRCYISVAAANGCIYAMGGYDGHTRVNTAEKYDPTRNQWYVIANMHHVRSDASATSFNGKVYIAGGFDGQQVLSNAEMYDPITSAWTEIRQMASPRSGVNLITYNDSIYVIGGFNGASRLTTVERYDRRNNTWFPVASMISPRSNFAAATVDDCIYVIGGFNGLTTISSVECYDYSKDVWTVVAGMNINRSALSACVVHGIPNAREYSFLGSVSDTS